MRKVVDIGTGNVYRTSCDSTGDFTIRCFVEWSASETDVDRASPRGNKLKDELSIVIGIGKRQDALNQVSHDARFKGYEPNPWSWVTDVHACLSLVSTAL